MAGENSNADAELNLYYESLDPLVEDFTLDDHQQVPAAQVDVQPDPAAPARALPGVPHQQMVGELQPAVQIPHQQVSPMIQLQFPQPAAPAMPLQHHQMLGGQSPATMPCHDRHHMVSELMLILPPQYRQAMMGDSPVTVPLQQQEMLGQGDPSQAVMTRQHQQMLVDPPAAYGGLHDQMPMLSPGGGEDHFFAAAPHDADGDLGLHALRIEDEEGHLPGGGGNAGSINVASIPRLRNHTRESVPEYVAPTIETMRNSGGRVKEVNNLLVASSSVIRAPPASVHPPVNNDLSRAMETDVLPRILSTTTGNPPPIAPPLPPAHPWEERDIMKSSGVQQPNPAGATVLLRMPQQQPRGTSRREEEEETRRYVRAAAAEAKEEVTTQYPVLKKLSRKKHDLGFRYHRIVKINDKIQKCEKVSRWHVGSLLSNIRRKVDEYLIEKRGIYVTFRNLVLKETSNCHDRPPRRNDDEAGPSGGSGAAGAAVA